LVFPPHIFFSIWRIQQRLSIAKETVTKSLLLLSVTTYNPTLYFLSPTKNLTNQGRVTRTKFVLAL
jgi:hypothetical protein